MMAAKLENHDDESFIILGTSPGSSLDLKCNGIHNGENSLDNTQIEEAMKDLPAEANMAFKAHFKLGDCPSPASMMVASTMITDDKSTEELQKRFGELLDENLILKETLKQNNDSMKEQFLLIASCQEDMMKTHMLHKEKFEETKELVERLRQENKKLKFDIQHLDDSRPRVAEGPPARSGPPSAVEFVSAPDDDTMNKLTAQLALVEKQRRQVIVENEKLTWQKESLEHIVDATSKERDDLKEKLKRVELQMLSRETEHALETEKLSFTIKQLKDQLQAVSGDTSVSLEEVKRRDVTIQQLQNKIAMLQNELKTAQLKILDLENVKLQFSKHKSDANETVKVYKDQIQDLQNKLKEASTIVFQPARISCGAAESDQSNVNANVKLYDRTLKHLAELLNVLIYGLSDSLAETVGLLGSLSDLELGRCSAGQLRAGLAELKQQLEKQHSAVLSNIGQVRGTLSIFEGIFKDCSNILDSKAKEAKNPGTPNIEMLTSALVARGQELQMLKVEIDKLKEEKEDTELLKAQLELYKSDFEAERESRQEMASEKETVLTDLRKTQRMNQELTQQLDEVRRLNSDVYQRATAKRSAPSAAAPRPAAPSPRSPPSSTGNMFANRGPAHTLVNWGFSKVCILHYIPKKVMNRKNTLQ
ncbi:optineurin isoform X2 [Bombyx mori]|uniref:optineurin isoform X2 n=1 Tax=Bombyx mori TaxID=7091 RepID=UPI002ED675C7